MSQIDRQRQRRGIKNRERERETQRQIHRPSMRGHQAAMYPKPVCILHCNMLCCMLQAVDGSIRPQKAKVTTHFRLALDFPRSWGVPEFTPNPDTLWRAEDSSDWCLETTQNLQNEAWDHPKWSPKSKKKQTS